MEMESAKATGRIDWETPPEFFQKYDDIHNFTLDVCADGINQKVDRYFTEIEDGLQQDWSKDRCWCNPPYGRAVLGKWVRKRRNSSKRINTSAKGLI